MIPDSLFPGLPHAIAERARQELNGDEQLLFCSASKLGPAWLPAVLRPGSVYLALTTQRLIGFYPSRLGASPRSVMFTVPRAEVSASRDGGRLMLSVAVPGSDRRRTLQLSTNYTEESVRIFDALRAGHDSAD